MLSEEREREQKRNDDAQLTRLNVERELYGGMTMAGTERDPPDIEALAAAEHESWSGWATYSLDRQEREIRESYGKKRRGERSNRDRAAEAAVEAFRELPSTMRWRRQAGTPYDDLPEEERESDRVEARKKLKVYRPEEVTD